MSMFQIPELLCIGFFCHDLHEGKYLLGGTASYSSLMANQLGVETAVLTSVGSDFKFFDTFEKERIQVYNKPAEETTVFENLYYENHQRVQYMYHRAETLYSQDVPEIWKQVPVIKLCLIADEVDSSILEAFPNALIGATIQGWLRKWDDQGRIYPKPMDWEKLSAIDIVFMSDADVADLEYAIPQIVDHVKLAVMTKGKDGASIFFEGNEYAYPSFPVKEVDPTGAGDIFATSFLVHYHHTGSIELSAAFAHAAASFIVEDYGIKIPTMQKINNRYKEYISRFLTD